MCALSLRLLVQFLLLVAILVCAGRVHSALKFKWSVLYPLRSESGIFARRFLRSVLFYKLGCLVSLESF